MRWRSQGNVRWLEAELPGARAAFSTRLGGTSGGAFASLNLGLLTDDESRQVYENRTRLTAALGREPAGILFGRQVHGAEVESGTQPRATGWSAPGAEPNEVDGQATGRPELTPAVLVADCLPIALSGGGGVAMVHGGWRGLAGGIVERGAQAVGGASAAAIGPGVGPCCYEVGAEVLQTFSRLGDGIAGGRMLDLPEVAERLLREAGIEHVERADLCTSCERELFFSHRRDDGVTGRQAGLAWLS